MQRRRGGDSPARSAHTGDTNTGDGSTHTFQLQKTYSDSGAFYTRTIKKPVAGTVRVSVAGTEITTGFAVDSTTGIITITSAPSSGQVVKAGYEFDVPVRFNTDSIAINIAGFNAGEIPSIPIIEVRL